jgi:hypothetical protein
LPAGNQASIGGPTIREEICAYPFDILDFIPSFGALGGILVIWNSASFVGVIVDKMAFGLAISFTSLFKSAEFVDRLHSHVIVDGENWLFMGDFNFYRSLKDRNKPGGNLQDTLVFNDLLGHLGLIELPLKGRSFTLSNKQLD